MRVMRTSITTNYGNRNNLCKLSCWSRARKIEACWRPPKNIIRASIWPFKKRSKEDSGHYWMTENGFPSGMTTCKTPFINDTNLTVPSESGVRAILNWSSGPFVFRATMAKASHGRCFWSHRRLTGVFLSDGWVPWGTQGQRDDDGGQYTMLRHFYRFELCG